MATVKSRTVQTEHAEVVACDRCGNEVGESDIFEFQEMLRLVFVGGYASVWGDETRVEVDLCQRCHLVLFEGFARTSDALLVPSPRDEALLDALLPTDSEK